MVSASIISQLEGVKTNIINVGYQNIFQPGRTTFWAHALYGGVNNTKVGLSTAAADHVLGSLTTTDYFTATGITPGVTEIAYKWAERVAITICNHSPLPVFVKAHYVSPRGHIPTGLGTANTQGTSGWKAPMWDPAIIALGNSLSLRLGGDGSGTSTTMILGQQGFYDASATNLFSYGEGDGTAATSNVPQTWGDAFPNAGSIAVPHGVRIRDATEFMQMFNIYHTKNVVLAPEGVASFTLQDNDLKHLRPSIADMSELNPWSASTYDYTSYSKFIIFEVTGSLIGTSVHTSQTASTNAPTWLPTAAGTDELDIGAIAGHVTTHGGTIYSYFHRQFQHGRLTNEELELVPIRGNPILIAAPDAPISHVQDAPIK